MKMSCEILKKYNCCGLQQDDFTGEYPCDVCHSIEATQQSAEYANFDFFEKIEPRGKIREVDLYCSDCGVAMPWSEEKRGFFCTYCGRQQGEDPFFLGVEI